MVLLHKLFHVLEFHADNFVMKYVIIAVEHLTKFDSHFFCGYRNIRVFHKLEHLWSYGLRKVCLRISNTYKHIFEILSNRINLFSVFVYLCFFREFQIRSHVSYLFKCDNHSFQDFSPTKYIGCKERIHIDHEYRLLACMQHFRYIVHHMKHIVFNIQLYKTIISSGERSWSSSRTHLIYLLFSWIH